MAADSKEESETIERNKSHITGKFNTGSEEIDASKYFGEYASDLNAFESETRHLMLPEALNPNIYHTLLNYVGEPASLLSDGNGAIHIKDFMRECKTLNKNLKLNDNLETVSNRKKFQQTLAWKSVAPKYALYQFKPRRICQNPGPMTYDQLVYEIKIYRPFPRKGRVENIKIQQEIWFNGNRTLGDLKSALICHLDYCGLEDVSEKNPSLWVTGLPTVKTIQREFPACFFFINGTFYLDGPIDVSKCVRDFMERNNLGTCPTADLKSTKLEEIKLQIGRPYVYQHIGKCEHVFVISDIRFQTPDEPSEFYKSNSYVNAVCNANAKQCMLCSLSYANWLVKNFKKLTLSRVFLCHRCFLSYCYVDSRKAGEFQAYQYFDPMLFL